MSEEYSGFHGVVSFAERHIKAIAMAVGLLAVGGMFSFMHMPREIEPELKVSHALVEAKLPGAFLDELEAIVARPLEDFLIKSETIEQVEIFIADGAVAALVEFRDGNILDLREGLANSLVSLRSELKQSAPGIIGPQLRNGNGEVCDLFIGISSDESLPVSQIETQAELLASRLRSLGGVTYVGIAGKQARCVVIEYEDAELDMLDITPHLVQGYLRSHNFLSPGGYIEDKGRIVVASVDARLQSLEDLKDLPIRDPAMSNVTALNRMMKITVEDFTPQLNSMSIDGKPAILLTVSRNKKTNLFMFSSEIKETVASFIADNKLPLTGSVLLDQSVQLSGNIRQFIVNMSVSVGLVLVLLLLALRLHSAMLVAVTVPLTIFVSIAILHAIGSTLNMVSLAALILTTGMLLDNQIVIAERVDSLFVDNKGGRVRVVDGVSVLLAPVLAAVLTTIAGFMPTVLADTRSAEYVRDLTLIVSVVLFVSLVISFTLTPFLISLGGDRGKMHRRLCVAVQAGYESALRYFITHSRVLYCSLALVVILAIGMSVGLERAFFPGVSRDMIRIDLECPAGTTLAKTDAVMQKIRVAIAKANIVQDKCTVLSGMALPRMSVSDSGFVAGPHSAVMLCRPVDDTNKSIKRLREMVAGLVADDTLIRVRALAVGVQENWPVVLSLVGDDSVVLMRAAEHLQKVVTADGGFTHVHLDWGTPVDRYRVEPLRDKLARENVTAADLAFGVQAVLTGIPVHSSLKTEYGMLPMFIRARPGAKTPFKKLQFAYIYPSKGDPTLLSDVANVRKETAPASIVRQDGRYRIQVLAEVNDDSGCYGLQERFAGEAEKMKVLFPGVEFSVMGKDRVANDSTAKVYKLFPWTIALMGVIVLMQTGSFRVTFMVIGMIPFGLVGSLAALRLCGESYGFMAIVGIMGVTGIILNNGLVMLDHIRRRAEKYGLGVETVVAGASERLPAVILTSLCLVASCVTLVFNGSAMWRQLAISMIGGSVFTLIPILFLLPILSTGDIVKSCGIASKRH